MRFLYTFLAYLLLPLAFLRLLWRSRHNKAYRQRWSERMGGFPTTLEKCIWMHCASVGETIAAIPLIKALQQRYPELPMVITTMTMTGSERVRALLGDTVYHSYIPYDIPIAIHRFLRRTHPALFIAMETELWPNIFFACQHQQIPIVVANARLSETSARGYHRVKWLTQPLLQTITAMAVQTEKEAHRFTALGLPAERITLTGNIKFDIQAPDRLANQITQLREHLGMTRPLWIAASTHPGEEEIILAAHKEILATLPDALCILVPRHPERFEQVHSLIREKSFIVSRRSTSPEIQENTEVYLADCMGEMMLLYGVSDVAFIAGSFAAIGGHNMLEAAVQAKPILTGPILFNFAEISRALVAAGGMTIVETPALLAKAVVTLFQDSALRIEQGEKAKAFVKANRGALEKHLGLIDKVVIAPDHLSE